MKKLMVIFLCVGLSACSIRHQFDCPYQEGARCLSVDEIDRSIDASDRFKQTDSSATLSKIQSVLHFDESLIPSPLRDPETVLSLWLAPFYTQEGTYHEARRLHFVVKPAVWRGVDKMTEDKR